MVDYTALSAAVWVVFAGVCFGAFYAYYHRRLLGDLLRSVIAAGANDEQNAKTLSEIGYGSGIKKHFARFALKKGSVLRKTVVAVYEEKDPVKKHSDELFVKAQQVHDQRYYVPEDRRITAEVRYDGKGTTATTLMLTVAAFFVAAIVVVSLLPWIIRNYHNLINPTDSVPDDPDTGYEQEVQLPDSTEDTSSDADEIEPDDGSQGNTIDYTLPQ